MFLFKARDFKCYEINTSFNKLKDHYKEGGSNEDN